eukprot:Lithocolla_globosa_v1_NODE_4488_length_1423_cov_5.861111.p2 type:complete len:180 gc:universal NODE_4488_length_1423_cov_5.861111:858-1397(+)
MIAAAGNTSYVAMSTLPLKHTVLNPESYESFLSSVDSTSMEDLYNLQLISFGNGSYGQLGNGMYKHVQGYGVRVRKLCNLTEYDEKEKKVVPIKIAELSASQYHVAATLSTPNRDIFMWGANKDLQLLIDGKSPCCVPKKGKSLLNNELALQLNHPLSPFPSQKIYCGDTFTILYAAKP